MSLRFIDDTLDSLIRRYGISVNIHQSESNEIDFNTGRRESTNTHTAKVSKALVMPAKQDMTHQPTRVPGAYYNLSESKVVFSKKLAPHFLDLKNEGLRVEVYDKLWAVNGKESFANNKHIHLHISGEIE